MERSNLSSIGVLMTRKPFQQKARAIYSIELLFQRSAQQMVSVRPPSKRTSSKRTSNRVTANFDAVFETQVASPPPPA